MHRALGGRRTIRFAWRDRLPVARWGLAELQIMRLAAGGAVAGAGRARAAVVLGGGRAAGGARRGGSRSSAIRGGPFPPTPTRSSSPADGKVAEVTELDHYDFLDGPAVRIGIFLSIFNVHVNRAPRAGRVLAMHYKPGEFLDARNPESAIRNEFMWIGFEDAERPGLRFAVRQISGLLARRIVCALRPGQAVSRGEKFGMIKLGSRTELILPRDAVRVEVAVGQTVQAGSTVVARVVG